jgi:hypothetical protein
MKNEERLEPFRGKFFKVLDAKEVFKLNNTDYERYLKSLYPEQRKREIRYLEGYGND